MVNFDPFTISILYHFSARSFHSTNTLIKDMEEIYGEKGAPVARETNYYESQRNRREENFAPSYQEQPYRRQEHRDETFHQQQSGKFSQSFLRWIVGRRVTACN